MPANTLDFQPPPPPRWRCPVDNTHSTKMSGSFFMIARRYLPRKKNPITMFVGVQCRIFVSTPSRYRVTSVFLFGGRASHELTRATTSFTQELISRATVTQNINVVFLFKYRRGYSSLSTSPCILVADSHSGCRFLYILRYHAQLMPAGQLDFHHHPSLPCTLLPSSNEYVIPKTSPQRKYWQFF